MRVVAQECVGASGAAVFVRVDRVGVAADGVRAAGIGAAPVELVADDVSMRGRDREVGTRRAHAPATGAPSERRQKN